MNAKKSVLFIDDDKHLTRIVHDFLTHEHFDVHTAAGAEEGLHLLETLTPDIIVLDISMPGIGGIGFLKRISNPDGTLKHPVLVLTARAVMKEFFETVPVDGFMPKPCSELDLIRKIRDIIDDREHRKQAAAQRDATATRQCVVLGEDDSKTWPAYVKMFEEAGIRVQLAATGPEVLEKTVAARPNAVVMKETLPNMNGTSVARLIKSMPGTHGIPVIIHSTDRHGKPAVEGASHADMFLLNPTVREIIAAVRKLLN